MQRFKKFFTAGIAAGAIVVGSATFASAADMYVPEPVPQWSGFYMGIIGGYGWGTADFTPTEDFAGRIPGSSLKPEGGMIGGQIGMDFEAGDGMVWGVVGDVSWADMKDSICVDTSGLCGTSDPGRSDGTVKVEWFGTARGKFGVGMESAQLYLTGGLAMAGAKAGVTNVEGLGDNRSDSNTHVGWTVGAGVLYRFDGNVSIGGEYLYADFGKENYNFPGPNTNGGASIDLDMHVVRGSLLYNF